MSKKEDNLIKAGQMAAIGILFAPASFLAAPLSRKMEVCNGCGAANAKVDFVPDTIWGLYVGYACSIHDWMYDEGRTIEDKVEADRVFQNNLHRLIDLDKRWYTPKVLMHTRADIYWLLLYLRGGSAFWAGKN